LAVTRTEFQQLADVRIDEARVLLAQGKYDGAYYLAGYAVECALKACIAKRTRPDDFPDRTFAQQCYTHNIAALIDLAGLAAQRDADAAADGAFKDKKLWRIGPRQAGTLAKRKPKPSSFTMQSLTPCMEYSHGSSYAGRSRN
jgi:hypothetical protein